MASDEQASTLGYGASVCTMVDRYSKTGEQMSEPDLAIRLRTYSDQLGGITDEAADEIDRLRVTHHNQSSFIKEFHSCLNGIEHIRCIPGASIDGCWDAKAIREVVMVLVANCTRTWKDNWRGSEKGVSENARMHNEACDSERKRCEHRIVEDEDGQALCIQCCKYFGWYCQISTKHFCEYTGDEACIHCGAPEDRQ